MVHGPHGSNPVQLPPIDPEMSMFPPSIGEFPPYDPKVFNKFNEESGEEQMPPPHMLNFNSSE